MAYAWQHWARVAAMPNPLGYLYRVGQTAAQHQLRWRRRVVLPAEHAPDRVDALGDRADIGRALSRLRPDPRACVLLVHAYGWSYAETAGVLGLTHAAVRNHVHRGLAELRRLMED